MRSGCSPQLCMTARVRLTTSEVKTCSPVMGHTPPFASEPATAAMILHVACVRTALFVRPSCTTSAESPVSGGRAQQQATGVRAC